MKLLSYPTREYGGFVWCYMGPDKENPPPLPKLDILARTDGEHILVHNGDIRPYSYLNFMENFADMPHVYVLHALVPGAVSAVSARGFVEYGPFADEISATVTFAGGTVARLETSRVATARKRGLKAVYADGVVEIDFLTRQVINTTPRPLGMLEMGDPLGESVSGFVAAARGVAPALVTAEQAAQALSTALLIEEAAGVSQPLPVAERRIVAVAG